LRRIERVEAPFDSIELKDKAMETPIMKINHGKTKSATVNPFHLKNKKMQKKEKCLRLEFQEKKKTKSLTRNG
jgi:hypothetical protein